jgi:hypothetical protein
MGVPSDRTSVPPMRPHDIGRLPSSGPDGEPVLHADRIEVLMMQRLDFTCVPPVARSELCISTLPDLGSKAISLPVGSTGHRHLRR